ELGGEPPDDRALLHGRPGIFDKPVPSGQIATIGLRGRGAHPVRSVCRVPDRQSIWDRRLILVTGKGGVGKSVVSAALAKAAHAAGRRVLVAEVTPDVSTFSRLLAHFGHATSKGEEPFLIEPRLSGARITPSTGHKLFLRAALRVRIVVDT